MWAVGYRFRKMIVFNQLGYGKQLEIWKSGYKQIMILKGLESFYLCRFWFSNFENHSVSIYFDSQILRIILKVYILILKFWESFGRYTVWFLALTLTHTHSFTHTLTLTNTLSHTHTLTYTLQGCKKSVSTRALLGANFHQPERFFKIGMGFLSICR